MDSIKEDIVLGVAKQLFINIMSHQDTHWDLASDVAEGSIEAAETWYEHQIAYCKDREDYEADGVA